MVAGAILLDTLLKELDAEEVTCAIWRFAKGCGSSTSIAPQKHTSPGSIGSRRAPPGR
jgi:hypothetical protein